jgi:hypothetical protein
LNLDELLEDAAARRREPPRPGEPPGPLLGEVIDTHHPHRPGRILVRLELDDGDVDERWLSCATHLRARAGDRVLLEWPRNFAEWIVIGVLAGDPNPPQALPDDGGPVLTLPPSQSLRVVASNGSPLLEIQQSDHGPVLRLLDRDLDLAVEGTLRLSADRIECTSGQGGMDLRTDGEMIMRSPRIRLN